MRSPLASRIRLRCRAISRFALNTRGSSRLFAFGSIRRALLFEGGASALPALSYRFAAFPCFFDAKKHVPY